MGSTTKTFSFKNTNRELVNKKLEELLLLINTITISIPKLDWSDNLNSIRESELLGYSFIEKED